MSIRQDDVTAELRDEIELLRLVILSAHSAPSVGHMADAKAILEKEVRGGRTGREAHVSLPRR